jgi:hypothetical protein
MCEMPNEPTITNETRKDMGNMGYSLSGHARRQARGLPAALKGLNPFRFRESKQFEACRHAASQMGRLYGAVRDDADIFDISADELAALHGFAEHAAIKLFAATDAVAYHPRKMSAFPDKASITLASLASALKYDSVDDMRKHFATEIKKLHDQVHPPNEQVEPAELITREQEQS